MREHVGAVVVVRATSDAVLIAGGVTGIRAVIRHDPARRPAGDELTARSATSGLPMGYALAAAGAGGAQHRPQRRDGPVGGRSQPGRRWPGPQDVPAAGG